MRRYNMIKFPFYFLFFFLFFSFFFFNDSSVSEGKFRKNSGAGSR